MNKRFNNSIFMEKQPKIKPDPSNIIVDLSENKIKCSVCGAWVFMKSIYNGSTEIFTITQVKNNFKAKHSRCAK